MKKKTDFCNNKAWFVFNHPFTFMHLADAFIQSDLQYIQVIHLLSVWVFPGNWTHDLCAANAMLYHWATGFQTPIPKLDISSFIIHKAPLAIDYKSVKCDVLNWCTVLSVNEYTPFEKYNFKQYLNEHKKHFQNVDKTKFNTTSV